MIIFIPWKYLYDFKVGKSFLPKNNNKKKKSLITEVYIKFRN